VRTATIFFALTLLIVLAAPAWAGCPLDGVYSTTDTMLPGHASESEPTGQSGELGNAVFAQSWDGAALGTQWGLACPEICVEPVLLANTIDQYGNGDMVYLTEYCGGTLWLDGNGPWGNGDAEYLVDVLICQFTTTISFLGGQVALHNTDIDMHGHFQGCPETCVEFTVAAACQLGEDYGYGFPADFPLPVLGGSCMPDENLLGTWWDISEINMVISGCTVPTTDRNWSEVKSLYR